MPRPRVSTNLAISADGKISSTRRIPSGWTSRDDHARLLDLRQNADALLIGRGTLESDRMTMTVPGKSPQPLRCIVSKTGKLDPTHPLFSTPGGDIHLLVTGAPPPSLPPTLAPKVTVHHHSGCGVSPQLPAGLSSKITVHHQPLAAFLETLATDYQIQNLHCEGGGTLIRALAEIDAIDDFHLTLAAHTLFGGQQASTPTGIPGDFLPKSTHFEITHFAPRPDLGECFLSYSRRK